MPARVQLPIDWADLPRDDGPGRNARGRASFRRHFNRPTGLATHERVWVVLEQIGVDSTVGLNDQPLGSGGDDGSAAEFDITHLLADSNQLSLSVDFPQPAASGRFGEVRLEIRG